MPKKDRYGIIHAFIYEIGGTLKTIRGDVELDGENNLIHVYYKKIGSTKHTRMTFHVGPHMQNQAVRWEPGRQADKAFVTFRDYSHVEMIEIASFANVKMAGNFLFLTDSKGKEKSFDLRTYFVTYETTWRNDSLMWAERGLEAPVIEKDTPRRTVPQNVRLANLAKANKVKKANARANAAAGKATGNFTRRTSK